MCQQTLTGLYHNEVPVLVKLRAWPANRPPQRAHIPTGQGSGLYMCVCVCECTLKRTLVVFLLRRLGGEKAGVLFIYIFFSLLFYLWLTLYAVTCDEPHGGAVFAVITVMTICLLLSKLHDKSQTQSNIWRGGSQEKTSTESVCVFFFFLNTGVTLSCQGEGESLLLKDRPGN